MDTKTSDRFKRLKDEAERIATMTCLRVVGRYWWLYAFLWGQYLCEQALCRAGAHLVEQDRRHAKYRLRVLPHASVLFTLVLVSKKEWEGK